MDAGLAHLRKLEQRLTYVRWFGVLFGIVDILIQPGFPSRGTEIMAWVTIAALATGSLLIWGLSAHTSDERSQVGLGRAAFALDTLAIMSMVWIFALNDPYIVWALLLLCPIEGALRYRLRGAVAGVGLVAIYLIFQTAYRSNILGDNFDISTYVFAVGLSGLVAGVTGSMANQWHAQNVAFQQQSLKLAEVDELKDRFLAITSHEIRGPLTAIMAAADTVITKRERLTPEQHETMLRMIASQAKQMARLVDDLQITSQAQAGQLALQLAWTDLAGTIEHALEAAASKRRQHRVEVFVEPLACEFDATRVDQIVRNLVENAYKYSPAKTVVAVSARARPGGITITVADSGPGIPPAERGQLFRAFSRIEETAAGQDGVGLGLYVVSQLVATMGGHIDLTSSSQGTSFVISLPCETRPAAAPQLGVIEGGAEADGEPNQAPNPTIEGPAAIG